MVYAEPDNTLGHVQNVDGIHVIFAQSHEFCTLATLVFFKVTMISISLIS